MSSILEKFREKLLLLDMESKDDIKDIIKEIRAQIKVEIENVKICREEGNIFVSDFKIKMIFMICIVKVLRKLKNRYEELSNQNQNQNLDNLNIYDEIIEINRLAYITIDDNDNHV